VDKEHLQVAVTDLGNRVDDWKSLKIEAFGELLRFGTFTVLKGDGGRDTEREVRMVLSDVDRKFWSQNALFSFLGQPMETTLKLSDVDLPPFVQWPSPGPSLQPGQPRRASLPTITEESKLPGGKCDTNVRRLDLAKLGKTSTITRSLLHKEADDIPSSSLNPKRSISSLFSRLKTSNHGTGPPTHCTSLQNSTVLGHQAH
jgi:cell division control protein 24